MNMDEVVEDLKNTRIDIALGRSDRLNWKFFMEKYNCRVICEVGVLYGANFRQMIEHSPDLAVAVDSWVNDGIPSHSDGLDTQQDYDIMYQGMLQLQLEKPFVKVCRGYSHDIVKEFPDEFFDLVYIDADHTFEGCLQDLIDWYPKVKPGRFFVGDDYRTWWSHRVNLKMNVYKAVASFAHQMNRIVHVLPKQGWAIFK